MVYLSRKQLHKKGMISWALQLKSEQEQFYRFHLIKIQCPSTTFDQYSQISCQIKLGDQQIINIPQSIFINFKFQ